MSENSPTKSNNILTGGHIGVVLLTALLGALGFGALKDTVKETSETVARTNVAVEMIRGTVDEQSKKLDHLAGQQSKIQQLQLPKVESELAAVTQRLQALELKVNAN